LALIQAIEQIVPEHGEETEESSVLLPSNRK
jgi:hypothetical protein